MCIQSEMDVWFWITNRCACVGDFRSQSLFEGISLSRLMALSSSDFSIFAIDRGHYTKLLFLKNDMLQIWNKICGEICHFLFQHQKFNWILFNSINNNIPHMADASKEIHTLFIKWEGYYILGNAWFEFLSGTSHEEINQVWKSQNG